MAVIMPERATSRPRLVVVGGTEGELHPPLFPAAAVKSIEPPIQDWADRIVLKFVLALLLVGTTAVGAIGASIAIHFLPAQQQTGDAASQENASDTTGSREEHNLIGRAVDQ